jgi:hypothetical protein
MGSEIYEVRARGPRGGPAMCHVVQLGAHDGRGRGPYEMRKVRPADLRQGASWFKWDKLDLPYDGHPIVSQIFFPFGDKAIDQTQDVVVLNAVIAHYRFLLGQNEKVELEFVGHADARGAASFNDRLALPRAEAVRKYVDRGIRAGASAHLPTMLGYKSKATSLGESDATGNHTFDRRVDIVFRTVNAKHYVKEDPAFITGKADGKLTRNLLFRQWGGASAGELFSAEVMEIEIKNADTGQRAFYVYMGANVGVSALPVSVSSESTDYEAKTIPASFGFVDVDDFDGPGSVSSAQFLASGQCLIFEGVKLQQSKKVLRKSGIQFCFVGFSLLNLQAGASLGAGYWRRQPYRNEHERRAYNEKIAAEQRRKTQK